MKALIFHEPGKVSIEQRSEPQPGPRDILLRVGAASICASDIRVYRGEKKARAGVIPGHETAGVIAAVGSEVTEFRPGDRVVVCPIVADGRCYFCLQGKRNRCLNRITLGYEEDGGLAEYMLIPDRLLDLGHVFRVPDDLPLSRAALTEPLACVLNSMEICRIPAGGSITVVGAGPMGLMHLQIAHAMGIKQVIMVEPDAERRNAAESMGADAVVTPEAAKDSVMRLTDGLGTDAVIVSVGAAGAVDTALPLVRKQGFVNFFGGFPPGTVINFDPNYVHYNEVFITGSQNAEPDQYRRSLQLLRLMPEMDQIVTHRYGIDDGTEAYMSRVRGEGLKSMIVFGES
jgi:L-iditol 2-dehydrogenase